MQPPTAFQSSTIYASRVKSEAQQEPVLVLTIAPKSASLATELEMLSRVSAGVPMQSKLIKYVTKTAGTQHLRLLCPRLEVISRWFRMESL